MKLAVINDEISQDLDTAVQAAAQLGYAGLEIRSVGGVEPHRLDDAALTGIRSALDAAGLRAAGFAPPAFKAPLPRTGHEARNARRLLERACEQARILGAPQVRVFSFYRSDAPDPQLAGKTVRELLADVELPVPLVLETGTRTNTPTVATTLEFLDAVGRDDVGILWDPGNSVFSGWEDDPFPREYDLGRDRIQHVHVKDPRSTDRYVRLGDGDLDWPAIVRRLHADGYDGYVSLETHWRPGRDLSSDERDRPWGESFSAGAYSASVECMQRLRAWVDAAEADR